MRPSNGLVKGHGTPSLPRRRNSCYKAPGTRQFTISSSTTERADQATMPAHSTPAAILADHDPYFLVSWTPDSSGMAIEHPALVLKTQLSTHYPQLLEPWNLKQQAEEAEADRITHKAASFVQFFNGPIRTAKQPAAESHNTPASRDMSCDQELLPGTTTHWGDVRTCENHNTVFDVCKGCRIAHYSVDRGYDRKAVITRGARVPVCMGCAETAMVEFGPEFKGCACDTAWTCFRCREKELVGLHAVREARYEKGRCGWCEDLGKELVEFVEICLFCLELRIL
ncbi:hypothetical protein BDV95DRAFT_110775 [Massariosphaeria phaeospora]|uniref:Uncharacterized protein n=1 Tax=Massariosphaeria phaeospora TaxID=100035 RepID=A0A7C8I623_9PLEO|nr:hypothetical protein BDV95DRAFT_110775 [Massariosphaeria phaeospora]